MHGADQTADKRPLTCLKARKKGGLKLTSPSSKIYYSSINFHDNRKRSLNTRNNRLRHDFSVTRLTILQKHKTFW